MKKNFNFTEEFLPINNKRQYLLHCPCPDKNAPVVLWIHGGPGAAESVYAHRLTQLTEYCTVVHWDQPGAGKTLIENPGKYPTMDQLLQDLFIIVSCLKIKYWKDKIILLGHSFGSILATLYTLQRPEDVLCYIGVSQIISTYENEKLAFELLKKKITAAGNSADLKKIEKLSPYPEHGTDAMLKKMVRFRSLQGKYGIGRSVKSAGINMIQSPIAKWEDFSALRNGIVKNKALWEFFIGHALEQERRIYRVPVFYILGGADFMAPAVLARHYFESVQAPDKEIFEIKNAGHFMMQDHPDEFVEIIQKIIGDMTSDR